MNRRLFRWLLLTLVLVGVSVGAVYAYRFLSRPTVTVTEVVVGPVVHAFYSTGTIEPVREYPIKSNIAGVVSEVLVDKGDHLKKGDKLAFVAEPGLEFQANKAQAELTEKQARADQKTSPVLMELDARIQASTEILAIAQREERRITALLEKNAASQTDLDRALDRLKTVWSETESLKAQKETKRLELQREVDVAKAALSTAKWNLDQQTLRSPIDGVVLDRPVSLGTRLAINDHLMQIADVRPENLVMRAAVDEEDKTSVFPDQFVRMTLYAFPNRTFTGKVTRIYDQADVDRRTFEIDVAFAETNAGFAPGMTGELAFIIASKEKATVIPAQSLQNDAVYVVRNERVDRADVQIGLKSVERIEVVSGLVPGDRVVISAIGTSAGRLVRTSYRDPLQAAGLNKLAKEDEPFKAFSK